MSISQKIEKFGDCKMFCTPGHKGTLLKTDITEIEDSFPLDAISSAEQTVALLYGARQLRFLTGGSSIGVKAALMGQGDLLIQKNSHRSVTDAAELSNSKVFYIENDVKEGLSLPPTAAQIEDAIKKYPSVKTVVLTSPDYYGFAADLSAAEAVISAGKKLHIDAAHGAHLFFRPDLFATGIFRLAHSFNVSAHKTLPAFTQTAYLAINDEEAVERINHNLELLGTTSPFYPFLAGLENAAKITFRHRARYDELRLAAESLKARIRCIENDDFTRIVVDTKDFPQSGEISTAKNVFLQLKKRGIIAEKFDERYIIFIVTVCDSADDVDFLAEELCRIRDCL